MTGYEDKRQVFDILPRNCLVVAAGSARVFDAGRAVASEHAKTRAQRTRNNVKTIPVLF